MIPRALLAWCLLLAVAIGNGFFRESFLRPRMSLGAAQSVSTVLLSVLIVAVGLWVTPWVGPRSLQDAWTIGATWLVMTLAFEFLGGHFIFGRTWEELFADYNLFSGKIWVMVLVVTVMTPVVAFTRAGL